MKKKNDMKVGQGISTERANWNFSGNVADTFDEHVRKSVPLYNEGHELICNISDFFCHTDSTCYELGVSTGALITKLAIYNSHKPDIKWIGIDREQPMIDKAKERCKDIPNIELVCEDIALFNFQKSDFIVAYYVIQFIPPRLRQEIFNKIYESLNWGGAFVLFEKVRGPDARFQDMMTSIYTDFKLKNGFSTEEIVNKSQSLKGVLEPFSTKGNLGLLERAGFVDITTAMKYVCFEGFLAIK
jgi:tRNA (cmo5U34)-methyltransferase